MTGSAFTLAHDAAGRRIRSLPPVGKGTVIVLRPDVAALLPGTGDALDRVMALQGEVYRQSDGRRTLRVELGGSGYFLKAHHGVGWLEVIKNLSQLKLPVLNAQNEWQAIERLHALEIPTMTLAGYGARGWNPARIRSFVLTEELTDVVSLESYCENWGRQAPLGGAKLRLKRALIAKLADLARALHENGLNHRDFYICHLLLDVSSGDPVETGEPPRLFLIDLHRARCRSRTPRRAAIKDLAALYFSALELGLTRRDLLRFVRAYDGVPPDHGFGRTWFWRAVERRARRLQTKWVRMEHDAEP